MLHDVLMGIEYRELADRIGFVAGVDGTVVRQRALPVLGRGTGSDYRPVSPDLENEYQELEDLIGSLFGFAVAVSVVLDVAASVAVEVGQVAVVDADAGDCVEVLDPGPAGYGGVVDVAVAADIDVDAAVDFRSDRSARTWLDRSSGLD
ncbi:hypothetical protein IAT40_006696 [Kwoniella sp. CBS 6097]